MDINRYWEVTLKQDSHAMKEYFNQDAMIYWHNTNEQFNVDEFIQANCEYPGKWSGLIERLEKFGDLLITVTHVYATDQPLSFHVVSFIQLKNDKISLINEYWGDDGIAPKWRLDKHLGKPIK